MPVELDSESRRQLTSAGWGGAAGPGEEGREGIFH